MDIVTIVEVQNTQRNRATVFWRPILAVPVIVFISTFIPLGHWGWGVSGIIVLPVVLALLFRGIYPSYVLTFNHAILELQTRLTAYLLLLNDDFPSIERNPRIAVIFPNVEGGKALNPWLPLVKWLLALPLILVGVLYSIGSAAVTVIAWVAIVINGEMPGWASSYNLKIVQFWNRVAGYCMVLVSDSYPSFKL